MTNPWRSRERSSTPRTPGRLGHGHSLPGPWPRRPASLTSGASFKRPRPFPPASPTSRGCPATATGVSCFRGTLRRNALITLVLTLFALALAPAVSSAALPSDFWGVVANEAPEPAQAQTLERGGVESLRVPLNWSAIQSEPGAEPDWSSVDPFLRGAAETGISVLPFFVGRPSWAIAYEGVG